ncbi:hypothetical protein [Paenibacillus crassostreae]|uniref:Uncharacterized protein n=1 Tax=Paenibacillus crassostreae TaxID=1763538 RepID=A0A167AUJ9_9BACL|nr:hypothetical protein [Paenibacillus crassostreae]AOZ93619.1 hypothetical protein LPB68_16420 [Paenibacillus crassostreae]OAB71446.1 hypothetical protein PNBC_19290 [Paenibacillus crassostreae]
MIKLRKEYHIVSIKKIGVISFSRNAGVGEGVVKITYKDKNGDERYEINNLKFSLDSKDSWKITSILRD